MQEQFIDRAAHVPSSKHPTVPLCHCRVGLALCSFVEQACFRSIQIEPTDCRSLPCKRMGTIEEFLNKELHSQQPLPRSALQPPI